MRSLVLFLLLTFLSPRVLAFEFQEKKVSDDQRSRTSQDKSPSLDVELTDAIMQVRGFAERAQNFDSLDVKVEAVMHFADLLWHYDENYARQLFLTALESIRTAIADQRNINEPTAAKRQLRPELLIGLRSRLLAKVARHDSTLAKRWAKIDLDAEQTAMSVFTAMELLKGGFDVEVALDFARRRLDQVFRFFLGALLRGFAGAVFSHGG